MTSLLSTLLLALAACNIGLDPIQSGKDQAPVDSAQPQTFGDLVISRTSLDFGEVQLGSSTSETVTLRNEGDAPILVQNIELRWGQGFSITSSSIEGLEAGAETVLSLEFEPIVTGAHEDALIIETDAVDAEHLEVALSGWGTEQSGGDDDSGGSNDPSVEVDTSTVNFGTVDIGQVGSSTIQLTNTGTADLTIVRFTASESTFGWGQDFTLPYILRAGSTRSATLTYTPTAETTDRGTITIETSDPVRPDLSIAVQGQGYDRCSICAPLISVYTSSNSTTELSGLISFNCQPGSGTVTVQNIGDEPLVINSMTLVNDTANGSFSLSGWSGSTTLDPWDTTSVSVSYTSSSAVLWEGTYSFFGQTYNVLNILSNDPANSNYEVSLAALGTGC